MQQKFSSNNLATLIACVKNAGIDWDGENIADLLWLTSYIDAPESGESQESEPEPEPGDTVEIEIDNAPPAPPSSAAEFSLYSQTTQQTQTKKTKAPNKGIPFPTPTSPALRRTLALGRSLRPLMRRVDSYTQTELDEEATAEQTAERQFCMTMVQPARERWLELALVIEDSASSFLWRDTIRDFQQVLERQGAFRTVTVWYLQTSAGGSMALYAKRPVPEAMPRPRNPKGLIDASGRRLILVISDCISPAWRQGRLQTDYLNQWAKHGPLAILQMLPSRMWSRTALEAGLQTTFSARGPGRTNAQLVDPLPQDFHGEYGSGLKLPVITLDPSSMAQWARVLAGFGDTQTAGIWYPLDELLDELDEPESIADAPVANQTEPDYAEQLVNQFSQTASQTARELASLMALVPVELSLVYIIQAKLLPESSPLHVAEVFLSGLIERVKPDGDGGERARQPSQGSLFDQQRHYQFVAGVRELLVDTVRTDSAEEVLNEVSAYIGNKLGRSIYSFMALLRLKDELETAGSEFVEFANVTKQALRRLGGQYAELVEAVETEEEEVRPATQVDAVEYPPLEVLEFTKGKLVDSDDELGVEYPPLQTANFEIVTVSLPDDGLELFEFQVATLERKRTGFLRRQRWVVTKTRGQAYRFVEELGADISLEMVAIPSGSFLMGSPEHELKRLNIEGPQREVTVAGFLMGRYPVTQAQWRAVAAMSQVDRELNADPSNFKGADRPVEQVSWEDALEFCKRLSSQTGRLYRLPSEAEWEYVCRAGTTTPFHFGETLTTEVANYNGNTYGNGPKGKDRNQTTSVTEFKIANAFGLCDMHGNVWEWCQDIWHDNYNNAPTDGSAWMTNGNDEYRILRGGSWINGPEYCRSARRDLNQPGYRNYFIGFRVVSAPPGSLP
ncbi:formylglycine-generating enzyme family protein [Leptothoe sp. LEGE 181152]|nr:formylglycine-generating enzyme family protein [Leptothoe sp. LEGE 181152]